MPNRPGRLRFRLLAVGALILASTQDVHPAAVSGESASEYAVKAAFLYQFIRYVTWPEDAFPSRDAPLVIGILGHDPFGNLIDKAVAGRSTMGRKIEVRRVTLEEAAARCHAVFIGRGDRAFLTHWLQTLQAKPILSVTESSEARTPGAIINFVTQGKSLRYDVNLNTAQKAGLKISTPMLVSARQVHGQMPDDEDSR